MPKEPFDYEIELEELEREMADQFEKLDTAPMRAEFRDELRQKLMDKLEQSQEEQPETDPAVKRDSTVNRQKSGDRFRGFLSSLKSPFKSLNSRGEETFRNWKTVTSFVLVLVMITTLFWGMGGTGLFIQTVQASEVSIKALKADQLGVDLTTAFLLTSKEPLNEKTVEEALKTQPQFTYTLDKQAGGREFKIIPQEPLNPNTIYTLSFDQTGIGNDSFSWAFQTKAQFRVIRSLPGDKSTHVPVDTGIEISFSHENVDVSKIKACFSISPTVQGTFEQHKKTVVFVPKDLKPSTLYTVTLKKGLSLSGTTETLQEDYIFRFETGPLNQNQPVFDFGMETALTEFSTKDQPFFPVYFFNYQQASSAIPPLHIDLYRYPDHREFQASLTKRDKIPRWSYLSWNNYREKFNSQYKVAEFDTQFFAVDQYTHYIILPQGLDAGYYAAEFKAGDVVKQAWFQVSDLAVYLAQGEDSSLFWINDLETKAPASEVQLSLASKNFTAKADESGAILVKEKLMGTERDYALVKSGNKEALVPLEPKEDWYSRSSGDAADYWKYLYLDRELYQPGDKVNFWGVIVPRGKETNSPKEITLELWSSEGPYYEGAETSPIVSKKINVNHSVYTGEIELPPLRTGYYYFQVKVGDIVLMSRGLSVETYQKPSYKLSLTQDKKAIFAGDHVNFNIKASFFEGTPVPGLKLNYFVEGDQDQLTTNSKGEAAISYRGTSRNEEQIPYSYVNLGVNATLPEAGEIHTSGEFYVFRSKVYLTGEAKRQLGGSFTLTTKLSRVDLTDINNGQYMAEEHFLKEPVANRPIKASIYQEVWTPEEIGQRYDYINKKVEKVYSYSYSTKHLSDFELVSDEKGLAEYTGKLNPENSYYIDLKAVDEEGRTFTRRIHVGGSGGTRPDYQYYFLQGAPGVSGYRTGEEAQVTFMKNDKEVIPSSQSILFYRGQRLIDDYQVSDSPKYVFTFNKEHIPNVNVYGVYFDGYAYHEAPGLSVPFARETKALKVKVTTDQAEYRPGDQVKLKVQVKDSNDKPVKDAQVNLNLVDEALFSLREQNVNFINSLYGDYLNLFQLTRKSHNHPDFRGGAEQGGEGPSDRKDFRDTVLFTTIQTDGQGQAEVSFELPDNLTSWRVTYHAFTEDLQAGSGTEQIPVKLPFFVEMTLNKAYLEGDSPIVTLRSYGEKLSDKAPVSYTMKLTSPNGEEKTFTATGISFTSADCQLPVLEAGKYSINVLAAGSGLQDSLTRDFMVVDSFQERTVTEHALLTEGMEIKGSAEGPTTVILSDYEKGQYLRGLFQLAWSNGSRLEQKLAASEARKLLKQYFPEETAYWSEGEDDKALLTYQRPDGGISILPYAESELKLSAVVASSTSGVFDHKALAGYFYRVLEGKTSEDDRSLALLGLAALREPVLLQISDYLAEPKLEPGVKISLALALLEIGDGTYAKKVFRELTNSYAQDLGATARIQVGADQDDMIEATTQMAILAARLDQPEKYKLYQYLLDNTGVDILNTVEQIQILKYNLKLMKTEPVSFTYELNGEKKIQTLKDTKILKLTILPKDLKNLKFSQIQGKVGVMTQYNLPINTGEKGISEDLAVSRTYSVNSSKTKSFKRTDLVKVTIAYQIGDKAPDGLYEIVDVLPAGLVPVTKPYNYFESRISTDWNYPSEVNGQKVVFLVGKGQHQITYYARMISPGEYGAEPTVLNNIKNNVIYTSGNEDRIFIK